METNTGRQVRLTMLCVSLVWGGMTLPEPARADADIVEEAHARTVPWSGYWWPHRQGAMQIPLKKYDHLVKSTAVEWEKKNHPSGDSVPEWFGYCHAWAASAVLEKEPSQERKATREQRQAQLEIGDQKGLLAVSHARDVANTYGDRFGDSAGSEDPQDLAPESLWRLLKLYVKQQGLPLVLDIEAGAEVWNYPIYAYRITKTGQRQNGLTTAQLSLWMADNGVSPNHVGLKVKYQTYQFEYRQANGSIVMGSGKWIGPSVKDHPDFAWYPYIARPENPEVQYAVVRELLDLPPNPPVNPDPPTEPEPPTPDPGTHPRPGTAPTETNGDPARPSQPAGVQPDTVVMSPIELVALVSRTSSFGLSVNTSPFGKSTFKAGEPVKLSMASEKSGYLYVVHVSPDGQLFQLFPQPGMDNRIKGGDAIQLPDDSWPNGLHAVRPYGNHRIKAFVTSRRVIVSGLQADFRPDQEQTQQTSIADQQQDDPKQDQQRPAQTQKTSNPQQQQQSAGIGFRWHPTQRQQLGQWVQRLLKDETDVSQELQEIDVVAILGEFAQSSVTFNVSPARGGAEGAVPATQE